MDDLLSLGEEKQVVKDDWRAREVRAEKIQINIGVSNALLKRATNLQEVSIFREDVPGFFTKLPTACRGPKDFSVKIQSLASVFEVNLTPLRVLIPTADLSLRSIGLTERWLEKKGISDYNQITSVWKNIIKLRKGPPVHARAMDETVEAVYFFGGKFPLSFSQLWDSVLDRFVESLVKFQEVLSSLMTS